MFQTKHILNRMMKLSLLVSVGFAMLLYEASPTLAATAPPLGLVKQFGALGGSGVTGAAGAGVIVNGDVGSSPTAAISNFPPSTVTSGFVVHLTNDAVVQQARSDATAAALNLASQEPGSVLLDAQLNGQVLTAGSYSFAATADLATGGNLTLNGPGVFVFNVNTALTANVGSNVIGSADPCNVFWRVGTGATLNGNIFLGTVISATGGVTVGDGADVTGRVVAATAVTMAGTGGNTIGGCSICPPIMLLPAPPLPQGTVGIPYDQTFTASGGTGPYTFSVTAGVLPTGLSPLTSGGLISGTPTTSGVFNFTVMATDANGCMGLQAYTIVINVPVCPTITLLPAPPLPQGTVGDLYNQSLTASGGTGPYAFSVTAGALPTGLSPLTSSGLISGTPTTSGIFNFSVIATDANGCMGLRAYTIVINAPTCPTITLLPLPPLPQGTENTAYSQTITASGGTGPYTFSVTVGSLPPGLLPITNNGVISGMPTTAGIYNFTVTATDANGCTGLRAYTIVINAPSCPTITLLPLPPLPQGTEDVVYNLTITASGGTGPYTFTITVGSLPPGLLPITNNGVIAGTPTTSGIYNFTITATDANGCTGLRAYTIVINAPTCPTITLLPLPPLPQGTEDVAYSQTITASGGTGPYSFALTVGSLPPGLLPITNNGVIAGTPTTAGIYNFTVTATDANGCTGLRAYTIVINAPTCPTITLLPLPPLPQGTEGVAYSQTITASGGTGPYTFSVTVGSLPPGLLPITNNGLIAGTPTTSGIYNFTVTATDANGCTGLRAYTIVINAPTCPTITLLPLPPLPQGTEDVAYSQTITASGGTGPYTFSVTVGSLPPGLLPITSNGVIAGTPTTSGIYNFTVTATDANGCTGLRAYTIVINAPSCPTITLLPLPPLPQGTENAAYSQTITASGGTGPYTFSVTVGSLPPGLLPITNNGVIAGTPTTSGIYNFTITATDANGCTGLRAYTIVINAPTCPTITLLPLPPLPQGTEDVAYSQTITASGGTGPYTFSVTVGSLPPGLLPITNNGVIAGTPTTSGIYNFTVTATDANGCNGLRAYTIVINAPTCPTITLLPLPPLPQGTEDVAYSQTITASGGTGPYTFTITVGSLPPGLLPITNNGVIAGTPTTSGIYNFTVTATDANGCTGLRAYTIVINAPTCPTITLLPLPPLPQGTEDVAYSQTITASGGTGPYTFSVTVGSLPPGLLPITNNGVIAGTPTTSGIYNFTVTATDANGCTGLRAYTIVINAPTCPTITLLPLPPLPQGTENVPYSQTITASGGTGPYTFTITVGSLPPGLLPITNNGVIAGTPTTSGIYNFTVTATDANGCNGLRAYTIVINAPTCPTITLLPLPPLPQGTEDVAYSQTITASGGTGPYTFSVTVGSLPPGLLPITNNGLIAGTPTTSGIYNFTVTATDANGCTGLRAYTIVINAPTCPTITLLPAPPLPQGTENAVYNQTITASGGTGPYTFSVTVGSLPPGLLPITNNGVIAGTPTTAGIYNFTITATDANGCTGLRAYTIVINAPTCPTITLLPLPPLPQGTEDVAYSQTITASGGTGPYTFTITVGSLPPGLLPITSNGLIAGTPTTAGIYNFTVTATDANGCTGLRAYTIVINAPTCPTITLLPLPPLPQGTENSAYNQTITASGGTGPYSFAVTVGSLPPGLLPITNNGLIAGTPTTSGIYNFTVTATDANGCTGLRAYTIVINAPTCPTITLLPLPPLPQGTENAVYNQTITASGGTGPYTFSVTVGSLPPGLLPITNNGVVAGTPTTAGIYNFTVTATDANGCTGLRAYTIVINAPTCPTITLLPLPPLPQGTEDVAYSQTITASGGAGPYTFSVTVGSLPPGLLPITNNGVISGTPTTSGIYNFTITATDADGCTGLRAYTIVINAPTCPTITLLPLPPLPQGTENTAYSQTITASGGTGPYIFSVTVGSLPPGLLPITNNGVIAGTPTTSGIYNFTVTATDANGCTGLRAYTIVINAPTCPTITLLPLPPLPQGTEDVAYSQTITASGGTGPYTFSVTVGSLPPGLLPITSNGVIAGTPTTSGIYNFTVTATDANGCTGLRAYTIVINAPSCPTITLLPLPPLPQGTENAAYSQTITASGGTGPYTFSVTVGSLPPGLLPITNNGVIAGTPTTSGIYNFTVTATDANGCTGLRAYTIVINAPTCPTITLLPLPPLPQGTENVAYSQTITASGGTGPYTFSVTVGSLPPGLLPITNNGVISGTPTTTGIYNFTVTATDANGCTGLRAYTIVINAPTCPTITLLPLPPLPQGTENVVYSQTITASGGTGPYTFSVTVGSLPPGLLPITNNGVIAGTPTTAGIYNFTVTATDANGCTGLRAYTIVINAPSCPTITLLPLPPLPQGTEDVAYSQTITASGGTGPYTFSVTVGSLPPGLLPITNNGVISGTPTTAGIYNFTVTATDANGCTGLRAYTIVINAPTCPTITLLPLPPLPQGTENVAYSQTIMASGGTGPYTFTITVGSLPPGLLPITNNGVIAGTPTTSGIYNFTVTATDANGCTGLRAYTIVINAPTCPTITLLPLPPLPQGTENVAYSQTITASGGTGPYTFSVTVGSLPPGLLPITNNGVIAGTPTTAGIYNFTVTATDANGCTGLRAYTIVINAPTCPTITLLPLPPLPQGTENAAYSQTITASGGTGPYTFSVTVGSLPPGLLPITNNGVIAGTPTTAGIYNFTVTATAANGCTGLRAYTIVINAPTCPTITLLPLPPLPQGTENTAYSQTITASGGTGPYSFAVTVGSLPPGLLPITNNGVIAGTPTTSGIYNFTVTATDANGCTGLRAYTIVINAPTCPTITLLPLPPLPQGTEDVAYSQTITASGGTGPYTFSVTVGSLPPGLLPITNNGVIAGTPTTAGIYNFTVTATDANGCTGLRAYTIVINAPTCPTITLLPAPPLPQGTENAVYNQTITASGGTEPYTFSVTVGSLPPGLLPITNNGVIAGTPTMSGIYNFTVTATDANGCTGLRAYTIVINAPTCPTITLLPLPPLPQGTEDVAYSQTITASGGTGPYTFSVTVGSLPPGLLPITNNGVIAGTPTTSGIYNFTVTATDANGCTGLRAYTIVINAPTCPTITLLPLPPLPQGTENVAYSQTITASGGTGPYTFSVTVGSLPPGLLPITNNGVISGTPTTTGIYNFTVTATDANGCTGLRAYTIVINAPTCPTITLLPLPPLPQGTENVVYSQTITASGGTGPYTFSVTVGSLPPGLLPITNNGVIAGTPTTAGIYNFTVTATDANGCTGLRAYTIVINAPTCPTITLLPLPPLPQGTEDVAYSQTITASGGTGPYTFSVTVGSLPPGLLPITNNGVISGTPTTAGIYNFTVTATDANGCTGLRAYTIVINAPTCPTITLLPLPPLPQGTENVAYSQTIMASGGTGPYTFTITVGSLPPGLLPITNNGVIAGTPTTSGIYNFTVTATDANGCTGLRAYTIVINAPTCPTITLLPLPPLPQGTENVAYSQTITASGGTGPYTFSVTVGSLPPGLLPITNNGVIAGTPTTAGIYNFTVTATDANGCTGLRAYTIVINAPTCPTITLLPLPPLPQGTENAAYSQTITASGGTGPYTFSVTVGSLPPGLLPITNNGVIAGTPTTAGIYNFTVTATDANGCTGLRAYTIVINAPTCPTITLLPLPPLPQGTENTAYSQTITASGGTGPYSFAVTVGSLPPGLLPITNNGVIAGTPTTSGIYNFTVTATDANGCTGLRAYTIVINAPTCPTITLLPIPPLPQGTEDVAYSQTITASGGTGPYTFSVTVGSLPPGLLPITSNGVIAGTPTTAGIYNFTVTATDANGCTGLRAYTIVINAPTCPTITLLPLPPLPQGTENTAYSQTITASGGTGPYTFSVTVGSLPPGLLPITNNGVIAGTPTTSGIYNFTVTATDANGCTGLRAYTIVINAPTCPTITLLPLPPLPQGTEDVAYSQTITASGGTGPYTFSVTVGSLPPGLLPITNNGVIAGTPTTAGIYNFTVTATDANGCTGLRAYTIVINAPTCPTITLLPLPPLPQGTENAAYSQTITASGGTGPYTFNVTVGSLPPGLLPITNNGVIAGTPTTAGIYNFTVTATDANGCTGLRAYTIVINAPTCPTITLLPLPPLPQGTENAVYNQTITASGGTGPYTFSVTVGSLPPGLLPITNNGVIAGTPTTSGIYNFTVTATDANGCTGLRAYTIVINAPSCPTITLLPLPPLPQGTENAVYNQTITASGGTGPYTFSVTVGSLPPGLLPITNNGVIAGTPTTSGIYNFTVTATDANGCTGLRAYTIVINAPTCPTITLLPIPPLPQGTEDVAYSQTITASGGTGPYSFAVTVGSLPPGLLPITNNGVIAGTPTTAGIYNFTVTATDANGCTGLLAYTVTIAEVLTAKLGLIKTVNNMGGGTATAIQFTLTATGDVSTGSSIITGTTPVTAANVPVGVYTITETGPAGYTAGFSVIGGGTLAGNKLTITAADAGKTITLTIANTFTQNVTSIPTLSEWGMIIFMMLLGIISIYYMKRQKAKI